jgi:hypothetical protein
MYPTAALSGSFIQGVLVSPRFVAYVIDSLIAELNCCILYERWFKQSVCGYDFYEIQLSFAALITCIALFDPE